MSSDNLSLKAGTVCATCNNPDPCLQSIEVGEFDGRTHIWPVESSIKLSLVDQGQGVKGWFSVESKCGKPDCPQATLNYDNTAKKLSAGICNAETLYFKEPNSLSYDNINVGSLWSYLNNIITPKDVFSEPHSYLLSVQGCIEQITPVALDVYPSVQLHVATAFVYELAGRERTWKERRDEQKKHSILMHKVRPKDGNQLRGGWTVHTDQFAITNKSQLTLDYALNICGVDYSDKFSHKTKVLKTVKTLEQISKIEQFVSNMQNHLLPDPFSSKNDRSFKPLQIIFNPISIGLAYTYERLENNATGTHYIGFNSEPFISISIKADIIQLIAAYARSEKIVGKCREIVKENLNVESYLQFTASASMDIGAAYSKNEWAFKFGDNNKLSGSALGVISFFVKAKMLFIKVSLTATGTAKTSFGLALDEHEYGLDLVCYHDGITAEVEILADFSAEEDMGKAKAKKKKKENEDAKKDEDDSNKDNDLEYKETIVLGAPLKIDESKARINIFGSPRKML
ncbi:hypothetical protein [Siccibacter colletis]|uniref:Uncharacterized protein n=1 Tax=Siccibacter colletis TaxID=1505757 RepID=A0ABY6JIS8_9ENTR|nr:hypothetical protein [Siccibacter colletis]UYU33665.1 hypothetical protein KFZ77_09240 [Siccibacter colletis]